MKRIITVFVTSLLLGALLLTSLVSCFNTGKAEKYDKALALIESGEYEEAYEILSALGDYKDTEKHLSRFYTFLSKTQRNTNGAVKGATITYNEDNLPIKTSATRADGTNCVYE